MQINNKVKSSSQRGLILGESPLPSAPREDALVKLDTPKSNPNFQLSSILSKQFVLGEIQGSSSIVKPGISYLSQEDSEEFSMHNNSPSSMKSKFLSQFAEDLPKTGRLSEFLEQLHNNHKLKLKALTSKNAKEIVPIENKISLHSEQMTEWQRKQEEIEFNDLFVKSQYGKFLIKEWDNEYFRLLEEVKHEVHHQKLQEQMESSGSKDFIAAAKLKMFGKLTRHVEDFKPDKLLLRRLNIADPFEHRDFKADYTLQSLSKDNSSKFETRMNGLLEDVGLLNPKQTAKADSILPDLPLHQLEALQNEVKETIIEKPPLDLFKAIFDDEDDIVTAPVVLIKNPYENHSIPIGKTPFINSETIDFLSNVFPSTLSSNHDDLPIESIDKNIENTRNPNRDDFHIESSNSNVGNIIRCDENIKSQSSAELIKYSR